MLLISVTICLSGPLAVLAAYLAIGLPILVCASSIPTYLLGMSAHKTSILELIMLGKDSSFLNGEDQPTPAVQAGRYRTRTFGRFHVLPFPTSRLDVQFSSPHKKQWQSIRMLCEVCKGIEIDRLDLSPMIPQTRPGWMECGYQHFPSYLEIVESANWGCDLCFWIHAAVYTHFPPFYKRNHPSLLTLPVSLGINPLPSNADANKGGSELLIYVLAQLRNHQTPYFVIGRLGLFIDRNSPAAAPGVNLISGRPVAFDSRSEECFFLARQWLNDCTENHGSCTHPDATHLVMADVDTAVDVKHPTPATFTPTRTINVGPSDGSQEPFLQVHSQDKTSRESRQTLRWVALSHRWGGSSPLITTLATFDERRDRIPLESLPQTFRDAVIVTRELGLQHLWIDSLCIVQDSPEDWNKEAAMMGDVYKYSYLAVAAEAAENCDAGFLKPRVYPRAYTRAETKSKTDNHAETPVRPASPLSLEFQSSKKSVGGTLLLRPSLTPFKKGEQERNGNLDARGWTLQESMLAPRTLQYGRDKMTWECKTLVTAEDDVTPVKYGLGNEGDTWEWTFKKRFLQVRQPSITLRSGSGLEESLSAREVLYFRWYTSICDFARRNLTQPSDKLPALSGLAGAFHTCLGDKYHAGLFEGDLHRGLFWEPEYRDAATHATPYRAPSWSWASIDGKIAASTMLNLCRKLVPTYSADILSVSTTPKSSNPFGEISGGSITIRGHWRYASEYDEVEVMKHNTGISLKSSAGDMEAISCKFDSGSGKDDARRLEDRSSWGVVLIANWRSHQINSEPELMGLVLEWIANEGKGGDGGGSWRRIGIASIHGHYHEKYPNIYPKPKAWDWKTVTII